MGVLTIYSSEAGFFDDEEVQLVDELAGDISLALQYMEQEGQRRATEIALQDSEQRYRSLFENSMEAILFAVPDGTILAANPAAVRLFGYSEEELTRMGRDAVVDRTDPRLAAALEERRQKGRAVAELTLRRKDGSTFIGELTSTVFTDSAGRARSSLFIRDVSQSRQMQEQLNRAQRLETAGRIAGQVAHDFNNLLGPIAAYPELIKMQLPQGSPLNNYCDAMLTAAEQMAGINEDMMALARRGLFQEQAVDLNQLVRDAISHIGSPPETLTVRAELAPNLLPVGGSPAQISRALSNLIVNGREAMQEIGTLRISTENVYLDRPLARYSRVEMGEYVRLSVSDMGCGIPEEVKGKIFDAFFSTKTALRRKGCGLGLSVVHGIVEDHRGYIDLETELHKGTTFHLYFPARRDLAPVAGREEVLPHGKERVLVVDDDPIQRAVVTELLTTLGYRVETVSSGEEAVEHASCCKPDLMLLDMVMTGIDGAEAFRQIRAIFPDQKAIVVSGFAETDRVKDALSMGAGRYLRKPLSLDTLAMAIRQELG